MSDQPAQTTPEEQAHARKLALAKAYLDVFGDPAGTLNESQRLVWEEQRRQCFAEASTLALDRNGAVDTHATLAHEGRRQDFIRITGLIRWVLTPEEQRQKPNVIR